MSEIKLNYNNLVNLQIKSDLSTLKGYWKVNQSIDYKLILFVNIAKRFSR
jgi:hypothetical protein